MRKEDGLKKLVKGREEDRITGWINEERKTGREVVNGREVAKGREKDEVGKEKGRMKFGR